MGQASETADRSTPVFLRLAGHPIRWRLLEELSRSDRQVQELTGLVGEPQNLVSYHLRQLRTAGLVSVRRSAADGRVAYYTIDLDRCGDLLTAAGSALHPALRLVRPAPPPGRPPSRAGVLFVCTGNSARSPMAEGLLRHRAAGMDVFSAGVAPKPVHPRAVAVMAERGIDLAGRPGTHLDEFAGRRFGYVITLCDRVRPLCPPFAGNPVLAHWSIPDPARLPDGSDAFARTAAELSVRIDFLLHRITVPREDT
ncbi:MAG TPA: ArsR family transcriptional regulator [Micromonosporaceae bacterium]|nr:ArsR family transcriptional regulator [Micromonosporaceae bacterium]